MIMAQTKAHIAATTRYESNAYDKRCLRIRKDTEPTRDTITAAAESAGQSINAYIMDAIREKMEKGKDPGGIPEIVREKFID